VGRWQTRTCMPVPARCRPSRPSGLEPWPGASPGHSEALAGVPKGLGRLLDLCSGPSVEYVALLLAGVSRIPEVDGCPDGPAKPTASPQTPLVRKHIRRSLCRLSTTAASRLPPPWPSARSLHHLERYGTLARQLGGHRWGQAQRRLPHRNLARRAGEKGRRAPQGRVASSLDRNARGAG
jgi:hypothetical protein